MQIWPVLCVAGSRKSENSSPSFSLAASTGKGAQVTTCVCWSNQYHANGISTILKWYQLETATGPLDDIAGRFSLAPDCLIQSIRIALRWIRICNVCHED